MSTTASSTVVMWATASLNTIATVRRIVSRVCSPAKPLSCSCHTIRRSCVSKCRGISVHLRLNLSYGSTHSIISTTTIRYNLTIFTTGASVIKTFVRVASSNAYGPVTASSASSTTRTNITSTNYRVI